MPGWPSSETVAGRLRPLPDIASHDDTERSRAERQAVNTVIQGSAADLMKEAMIRACAELAARGVSTARLIAQIHDEMLFEVHEAHAADARAIIKHEMENVWIAKLRLPVSVTVGPSWADMV